jgi:hypothetical protein
LSAYAHAQACQSGRLLSGPKRMAARLTYRAPMIAPCRSSRRSLSSRIDCAHPSIQDARCGPYATGRRSQVTSRVACYVLQVACCMLRINGAIPATCPVGRNAHRTPWFMASEDDVTPAMRQAARHVASQEGDFADRRMRSATQALPTHNTCTRAHVIRHVWARCGADAESPSFAWFDSACGAKHAFFARDAHLDEYVVVFCHIAQLLNGHLPADLACSGEDATNGASLVPPSPPLRM